MRAKAIAILVALLAAVIVVPASGQKSGKKKKGLPVVTIGVAVDGPWERMDEIMDLFEMEIVELTSTEFDVRFPATKRAVADHSAAGVKSALDRLLSDPEVDMILTVGAITSNDVCLRGDLDKPVVSPFIINPEFQGIPRDERGSGVENLSYITYPADIPKDVQVFRQLVPFDEIVFLLSRNVRRAIPALSENMTQKIAGMGIEVKVAAVEASAEEALAAIPAGAQAVYIAPLLLMDDSEFKKLIRGLNARKIPTFSLLGRAEVEAGVFATLSPAFNFTRLARRVGLYFQRILLGEDPEELPVAFERREQLVVNMETARQINQFPSWDAITDAELLYEQPQDIERKLSLESAVNEAIARNLELKAIEREVAAGKQNINQARSALLPQLEASATGLQIDQDRAEASFGSQAERTFSGSASLTQLIYSEPAHANLSIQEHLQTARKDEREQLRLDLAEQAAITYLNVLRAQTFHRIQKENLQTTRSNLELAQIRVSIGQASRAEFFRWESEISADKIEVINAEARMRQAAIALNRLLHRPMEEPFLTIEADMNDPSLLTSDPRLFTYTDNIWYFEVFRDFMVEEGLRASPELAQLDAAIAAQERLFASARRSFWSPTIALRGEIENIFSRGGAGADGGGLELPPDLPPISFPTVDDLSWSVALNISLPIFNGAERFATRTQARETLEQLRYERDALAEQIEQRIRATLHESGASFPAIKLSREAAEAAKQNLELVSDAYSRGVLDIVQLLDAQNAALIAELGAESAIYDFLIDFMAVQRSIGKFDLFMDQQERQDWFERLEAFFERAGAAPRPRENNR